MKSLRSLLISVTANRVKGQSMHAMKIAITGGAGFIGAHLSKAYIDLGHDVLVIDSLLHTSHQALDPRARFYQVDIRDDKLRTILQQERPDIVSHHAALRHHSGPGEQSLAVADVNIRGLLHVLDSCVHAAVSKIIFSSDGNSLYSDMSPEQLPIREDTPLWPRCPYTISKATGEWYIRYYTQQYGLKHTILRYADVYGETEHTLPFHTLSYFIIMLLQQRRPIIRGTGNEIRDHIFIEDVVQANIQALTRGENQTLHISSGHGYTLNEMYSLVAQQMKSSLEPIHISNAMENVSPVILDNAKARYMLEWFPEYSITDGIKQAIALLQNSQKPLPKEPVPIGELRPMRDFSSINPHLINEEAALSGV